MNNELDNLENEIFFVETVNKSKFLLKVMTFVVYAVVFFVTFISFDKYCHSGQYFEGIGCILYPIFISSLITSIYQIIHFILILKDIPKKNTKSILGYLGAHFITLIIPIIIFNVVCIVFLPLILLFLFCSSISDEIDTINQES